MRYVTQPDDSSCGPTAILNALKWAGESVTLKDFLPFLQFSCQTFDLEDPDNYDLNGTTDTDFDRVLRYVSKGIFTVKKKHHPKVEDLKNHLEKGGTIALGYRWIHNGKYGDHFCFISGIEKGYWLVVNDHESIDYGTVVRRRQSTILKWLKISKQDPNAWLLTRKD